MTLLTSLSQLQGLQDKVEGLKPQLDAWLAAPAPLPGVTGKSGPSRGQEPPASPPSFKRSGAPPSRGQANPASFPPRRGPSPGQAPSETAGRSDVGGGQVNIAFQKPGVHSYRIVA